MHVFAIRGGVAVVLAMGRDDAIGRQPGKGGTSHVAILGDAAPDRCVAADRAQMDYANRVLFAAANFGSNETRKLQKTLHRSPLARHCQLGSTAVQVCTNSVTLNWY